MLCYFVTDLHGIKDRYEKLFAVILREKPDVVFLGGDLLPHKYSFFQTSGSDFIDDFLIFRFKELKYKMADAYPDVFLILGNDDARIEENRIIEAESHQIWKYVHNRSIILGGFTIYGYAYVPPTPFRLKDWERYDISRYIETGCIPIEDGIFTVEVDMKEILSSTIKKDLKMLITDEDLTSTIVLFHSPPHKTFLDRAALDGKYVDSAPLDVYVGSIAIRRFIEQRQPLLTLHGHIHESPRLTGYWKDKIKSTNCFSSAHDGKELALISFNTDDIEKAVRRLL